jgi:hypothetical protein
MRWPAFLLAICPVTIASAAPASEAIPERFAIAVNEPFSWGQEFIGASLYVGLARHQAIRANIASYPGPGAQASAIASAIFQDGRGFDRGSYFDVGIGWQWYPRELWQGPILEAGLVWREDKTRFSDVNDTSSVLEVDRDARGMLARGLGGWSWLFYDRVFIMAAIGGATGYERGTELVFLNDFGYT